MKKQPSPSPVPRRVAWGIVAAIALSLAGAWISGRIDTHRRADQAAAELETEEIRVARDQRERASAAEMRRIQDDFKREGRWLESQRKDAARQQELNAATRARISAAADRADTQDRAGR